MKRTVQQNQKFKNGDKVWRRFEAYTLNTDYFKDGTNVWFLEADGVSMAAVGDDAIFADSEVVERYSELFQNIRLLENELPHGAVFNYYDALRKLEGLWIYGLNHPDQGVETYQTARRFYEGMIKRYLYVTQVEEFMGMKLFRQ